MEFRDHWVRCSMCFVASIVVTEWSFQVFVVSDQPSIFIDERCGLQFFPCPVWSSEFSSLSNIDFDNQEKGSSLFLYINMCVNGKKKYSLN